MTKYVCDVCHGGIDRAVGFSVHTQVSMPERGTNMLNEGERKEIATRLTGDFCGFDCLHKRLLTAVAVARAAIPAVAAVDAVKRARLAKATRGRGGRR